MADLDLSHLVKPLVWKPNTDYRVGGIIAGDFAGFWTSHMSDDMTTWEWSNPYGKTTGDFQTQAEAIASLQAERTARVLAALDLDAVQALVEAANTARLALAGYIGRQSGCDALDAALAQITKGTDK